MPLAPLQDQLLSADVLAAAPDHPLRDARNFRESSLNQEKVNYQ